MLKSQIMTTPNSPWREVSTQHPPRNEPVLLWLPNIQQVLIGCQIIGTDGLSKWAQCYDDWHWYPDSNRYESPTAEEADLNPSHWAFLPVPPAN
jgi:hypothetical protein